eukprot:93717-Pyramimonas_sp.AAC.1
MGRVQSPQHGGASQKHGDLATAQRGGRRHATCDKMAAARPRQRRRPAPDVQTPHIHLGVRPRPTHQQPCGCRHNGQQQVPIQ